MPISLTDNMLSPDREGFRPATVLRTYWSALFFAGALGIAPILGAQLARPRANSGASLPLDAHPVSNAARILAAPRTEPNPYRMIHQDVVIDDIAWDTTADRKYDIAGTQWSVTWGTGHYAGAVTSTLVTTVPSDSIRFDAGLSQTVTAVTDVQGKPLVYTRNGDVLYIRLPKHVPVNDTVRCVIHFTARGSDNGQGGSSAATFVNGQPGRPGHAQQLWTEVRGRENWFPSWGSNANILTWDVTVTVPAKYTVVSNGQLVSDRPTPGGRHTVHWRQEIPAPVFGATLAVAPLVTIHESWRVRGKKGTVGRRIPLEANVYPEDTANARLALRQTAHVLDVYSRRTGVPFPWARFSITHVNERIGGGGRDPVTAMQYEGDLPDARTYHDRPELLAKIFAHEPAHDWFGSWVVAAESHDWLQEGFADFMTAEYWGASQGAHARDEFLFMYNRGWIHPNENGALVNFGRPSNNAYFRGALTVYMLERQLGTEKFWRSVHTYLTANAHHVATTDDLRAAILKTTGEDLGWFFDQWVYRPGGPQFSIATAYDSTAHRVTFTVRQLQDTTRSVDVTPIGDTVVYQVPGAYRIPVRAVVGTRQGEVVQRTELTARTQTITVDHVMSGPLYVMLDGIEGVIGGLQFDQPTPWLVALLEREPTVWYTMWTIEQLQGRIANDTAALNALTRATTKARYASTRGLAAGALGATATDGTTGSHLTPNILSALTTAAHDTAVQVRVAALGALSRFDTTATVAVANEVFTRDSSDAVRATAVTVVAMLRAADTATVRNVLTRAIVLPSYANAIKRAAYAGLVSQSQMGRPCDATLRSVLEKQLGEDPQVAPTLEQLKASCPAPGAGSDKK